MNKYLASFLLITNLCFAQKIHSHNDYEQARPFWAAFEAGVNSIEADIYLMDGNLFVAHQKNEINPAKTLEKLYLEPLNQILKLRNRQELQILIDIKTDATSTLDTLIKLIGKYPKLTKSYAKKKSIKFVISGNRPSADDYANYPAFILFDHQSLQGLENKSKIALASFSFEKISKWKGNQPMNEEEKLQIKSMINQVHSFGLPIRFWATPDTPIAWKELNELDVDFINTDSPKACKDFFLNLKYKKIGK
jgi:alkaline phosphatase